MDFPTCYHLPSLSSAEASRNTFTITVTVIFLSSIFVSMYIHSAPYPQRRGRSKYGHQKSVSYIQTQSEKLPAIFIAYTGQRL